MPVLFSEKMRELRKLRNLSQKMVATQLHVGQTTIANYENGIRQPDLEKLVQIAEFYNVSVDVLLGREEQSERKKTEDVFSAEDYFSCLMAGNKEKARTIILSKLYAGVSSQEIYGGLIEAALVKTGSLWERGEVPVWQEYMISQIVIEHIALVKRRRQEVGKERRTLLCFLPGGETHGIGLRIIGNLLEEKGHRTFYFGEHLPVEDILKAVGSMKPDGLLMSVTMEKYLDSAQMIISKIRKSFGEMHPKILVGGKGPGALKDPIAQLGADFRCKNDEECHAFLTKSTIEK